MSRFSIPSPNFRLTLTWLPILVSISSMAVFKSDCCRAGPSVQHWDRPHLELAHLYQDEHPHHDFRRRACACNCGMGYHEYPCCVTQIQYFAGVAAEARLGRSRWRKGSLRIRINGGREAHWNSWLRSGRAAGRESGKCHGDGGISLYSQLSRFPRE